MTQYSCFCGKLCIAQEVDDATSQIAGQLQTGVKDALIFPPKAENVLDFGRHIDVSLSFRDTPTSCSLMEDKACY